MRRSLRQDKPPRARLGIDLVGLHGDLIDPEARAGWFVLAQGAAHHLDAEAERAPFTDAGLEPWIEGVPAHFIRVTPTHFFGLRGRRA